MAKNKKLPAGGVFNTINTSLYHFCGNNPIQFRDYDGNLVGIDDVFGWAIGRLMKTRSDDFFSGVSQNFCESWKLVGGTFNTYKGTDSFKSFMKNTTELGLRLTWNLPNELLGLIMGYAGIEIGGGVTMMDGDIQVVVTSGEYGACTLGSKVLTTYNCINFDDQLLSHEQGHYYQSLILGPTFMPIIGVPSFLWASYSSLGLTEKNYGWFYTEAWANKLGSSTYGE